MEEQQVVSSSGFKFNKKTVIGLIVLVLLITAIPIGVYLVQQKQIFKPKAAGLQPVSGPETSLTLVAPVTVVLGQEVRVGIWARSDIDAANLFVAKLKFPSDLLEVSSVMTSCQVRPACLDAKPACLMPEPADGWCPSAGGNNLFVKNWVEKTFDNTAGTISLTGGVPSPGFKTLGGSPPGVMIGNPGLMAEVVFKTKKTGSATISFDTDSAIYRNSDNVNILGITRNATVTIINEVPPSITPTPNCTPKPACWDSKGEVPPCRPPEPMGGWCQPSPTPTFFKGDVNGDGKITLVDMSALLSRWGKTGVEAGRADINSDGVVNTFDYSTLIQILIQNGVIKSAATLPTSLQR